MSKSTSETDEFHAQIHRRMVESGEWDRCVMPVSPDRSKRFTTSFRSQNSPPPHVQTLGARMGG